MMEELKSKERSDIIGKLTLSDTLLVELSRLHLTPKVLNRIGKLISLGVNWKAFFYGAIHHRIPGLLYYHIFNNELSVPPHFLNALKVYLAPLRVQSTQLFNELSQLERAFREIRSPVVILKGPVLARKIYRSSSIRFFADIDLLTYTECIPQVEECLYKLGFSYVAIDHQAGTISALDPVEINRPRPISSHRRPMMKKEGTSFRSPVVELHYPKVKLGSMDDESLISESGTFQDLGPGLRILSPEDLVIHATCHFYRHFRLALVTAVANSMGAFITHNPGVLKFLADIYACVYRYHKNDGNWDRLVERSININAAEIFFYGMYYLDLIYGRGTVPGNVLDALVKDRSIQVPLLNTSPSVASVKHLLKPEFRTANAVIGPDQWLFKPRHVSNEIIGQVKKWRAQNGVWPSAKCSRATYELEKTGVSNQAAWQCAEELSINEEEIDPRQYFLTHVTGGVWCQENKLRASVKLLWNDESLFVRTSVSAAMIHYVFPENIGHGEIVTVYISNILDEFAPIKRISCSICENGGLGRPEPPEFSSGAWYDIDLHSVQPAVNTARKGFCLDLRIPWNILEIYPTYGFRFGFDVEIVHRSEAMTLETALAWSGGEFLSEVTPAVHGTVTLV